MPSQRFDVRAQNRLLLTYRTAPLIEASVAGLLLGLVVFVFVFALLFDPAWLSWQTSLFDGGIAVVAVGLLLASRRRGPPIMVPESIELDEVRLQVQFHDGTNRSLLWTDPTFDLRIGSGMIWGKIRYGMVIPDWKALVILSDEARMGIVTMAERRGMALTDEPARGKGGRLVRISPRGSNPEPGAPLATPR